MHWTYKRAGRHSDLEQGDILVPTRALRKLFKSVHPHFDDDKYLGHIVTTQTCDLVRRGAQKKCEAQHISIAVIRPLGQVLFELFDQVCSPLATGIYLKSHKGRAKELLQRLFNQNEWKLGIFYIHPDADLSKRVPRGGPSGFGNNAVCLLRVSVSLKREHYDVLRRARCGRLRPEFANKLGWMAGNLYSRIATADWADKAGGETTMSTMIKDYLGDIETAEPRPTWLDQDQVDALAAAHVPLEGKSKSELEESLKTVRVERDVDRAVHEVSVALTTVMPDAPPDKVKTVCNRLINSAKFRKALRG